MNDLLRHRLKRFEIGMREEIKRLDDHFGRTPDREFTDVFVRRATNNYRATIFMEELNRRKKQADHQRTLDMFDPEGAA